MNTIKTYTIANKKKSQVQFGAYRSGRWHFQIGKFTYITKVCGGQLVAQQIGKILRACFLVNTDLTDATREQIQKLLQIRTLVDYVPISVGRGFAGMPNWPGYATVEVE